MDIRQCAELLIDIDKYYTRRLEGNVDICIDVRKERLISVTLGSVKFISPDVQDDQFARDIYKWLHNNKCRSKYMVRL